MGDHELHTLDLGRKGPHFTEIEAQQSYNKDVDELARTGKKQVLKRNFGFMSMLGFSCTLMSTWEGILVVFLIGYTNGGPAGLVYGFILTWIGTLSVFTVMGELASMVPTAGGQYHWVSILAPPFGRNYLSYLTGWLTVAAWQASLTTTGFFTGTLLQGIIVETVPSYVYERWHGTLLTWAVIFLGLFFNTIVSSSLPKIEGFVLILHILGFLACLIPLVYLGPHASPSTIFPVFNNGGGWSSVGLSFFVGLVGNATAFLGTDGAVHMSEEIKDASLVVPRSMVTSIFINGILAFSMLLAVLFCAGDLSVAAASPTGYPFIEIFAQATGSVAGATVMTAIVTTLAFSAIIATLASSARMAWSFSRDRGLPGWQIFKRVDARTSMPLYAIALATTLSCLLVLINVGSTTAFQDIISLVLTTLYATYMIPCSLLLWRRIRGDIRPPQENDNHNSIDGIKNLTWGPWRIPGAWGIANNILAIVYMIILIIFSFFPGATPVTPVTMNYSVVVTGGVVVFSTVYYFAHARKFYTGPIVEVRLEK